MKRLLAALSVLLFLSVSAKVALAAAPGVLLDHKLTGATKGETNVTLTFSLHVANPGTTQLTDLTLNLVPHSPYVRERVTVSVGSLGPQQEIDVPLTVVTPVQVDPDRVPKFPLFWSGSFLDADGKLVKFPAVSKPGGGK